MRPRLPRKLTPAGGRRYYLPDNAWRPFVRQSLADARALIVVIGGVKNGRLVSDSLREEIEMIQEDGHLEKTLFLMPPLYSVGEIRDRWQALVAQLFPLKGWDWAVKAKRILCLCIHPQGPVVITGSDRTELHYESALDIAGEFVTDRESLRDQSN